MKRIKRFGVIQTSKVTSIMLFFISAVVLVPVLLIGSLAGGLGGSENVFSFFGGGVFLIFVPIFYAIVGFIMTAIYCLVYNVIAKWVGGIEIEFEDVD